MVLPQSCLDEGGEGSLVVTYDPEANGSEERVRMGSSLVPGSCILTYAKHMLFQQCLHAGWIVVIHSFVQPTNQNGQLDVIKLGNDDLNCVL